ncbi:MAG: hypothetical protein MUC96_02415 [Myxococcaceae bacterium]|jgi:hypothetical protein|nr:hypothetical protein [Myxococcaceae bacterium]
MKTTIYEEQDKVKVEYDASKKLIIATWKSLLGPQFRKAIDAAANHVSKHGIKTWIADVSQARDVPSQDDHAWLSQTFDARIKPHGFERLINVLPQSAIVKLGASQWSKTVEKQGASGTIDVGSVAEALKLAA